MHISLAETKLGKARNKRTGESTTQRTGSSCPQGMHELEEEAYTVGVQNCYQLLGVTAASNASKGAFTQHIFVLDNLK